MAGLTTLVTRLDVERARELIAEEAPRIAETIKVIEEILTETREECLREQASQEHQIGDMIWNLEAGWGVCRRHVLTDDDVGLPAPAWRGQKSGQKEVFC